ncbi:MAG TPA: isoprenoid biosynthesis glyoxalase ElbB [Planctomycetota bacterium]|nr:isoprenoid biosynthesis glyoxalase ElbB [Planctomycetota bacterium]
MGKKVGVILSGCGYLDGSEIHEAVLTLYFLDKAGAEIVCLAPDKEQADVVDHVAGRPSPEKRGVMAESARIARGKIRDVAKVSAADLDAVVIPGGFGAAKNLCTFAKDGPNCQVDHGVARLLRDLHSSKKPIGALCIAPALVAKLFGADHKAQVTIGNDKGTGEAIVKMGATHVDKAAVDIHVDEANKIVTSPCYMLARGPADVGAGVEKLVARILKMA